ncbi:serine protease [Glycomyces sp. A-F 0318]|uniref:serine protease n=1 Tax=Glycomyces amatae TaxID=2881355 RepID=UPI001E473229|nr:serine protease [Glycomyces amatae]MCD0446314.1 serine protease [Glycomyces amatae]
MASKALVGLAVRRMTRRWTGTIVILAGTLGAVAALFDLALWVSIGAAVAAVLGGARALRMELLVPVRIAAVENATGALNGAHGAGSAVHLGRRRWVTAAYVVDPDQQVKIRTSGNIIAGYVVYHDTSSNLAVIIAEQDWAWRASALARAVDRGETIRAMGWVRQGSDEGHLNTLSLAADGTTNDGKIILTGPLLPSGFGGGPAVEPGSGRVVGLIYATVRGEYEHLNQTYVVPLAWLPRDFR